jgi:hypothetical protein
VDARDRQRGEGGGLGPGRRAACGCGLVGDGGEPPRAGPPTPGRATKCGLSWVGAGRAGRNALPRLAGPGLFVPVNGIGAKPPVGRGRKLQLQRQRQSAEDARIYPVGARAAVQQAASAPALRRRGRLQRWLGSRREHVILPILQRERAARCRAVQFAVEKLSSECTGEIARGIREDAWSQTWIFITGSKYTENWTARHQCSCTNTPHTHERF